MGIHIMKQTQFVQRTKAHYKLNIETNLLSYKIRQIISGTICYTKLNVSFLLSFTELQKTEH